MDARSYLIESDSSNIAKRKFKELLTNNLSEENIHITIKDFEIHKYRCKCVYCISVYIQNVGSFEVLGTKKTYYDAYTDIYAQILMKCKNR